MVWTWSWKYLGSEFHVIGPATEKALVDRTINRTRPIYAHHLTLSLNLIFTGANFLAITVHLITPRLVEVKDNKLEKEFGDGNIRQACGATPPARNGLMIGRRTNTEKRSRRTRTLTGVSSTWDMVVSCSTSDQFVIYTWLRCRRSIVDVQACVASRDRRQRERSYRRRRRRRRRRALGWWMTMFWLGRQTRVSISSYNNNIELPVHLFLPGRVLVSGFWFYD